jgi:SAM-dependent methyltransferase
MDWSYDILRKKWREIPSTEKERAESQDLLRLGDVELLAAWDAAYRSCSAGHGYGHRGWYHDLYRDKLSGRKVLDLGCGFGISTIHFAEHGARLTFSDIVEDNVKLVQRVCAIKRIEADFLYIDTHASFAKLPDDYDFVLAIGSLINSPLPFTREEVQAVLPHLRRPGRWLHFGYPKTRWTREGSLPFAEWGNRTDGPGTPWMIYHDREAIDYLFSPERYEVVFECEWHNSDFNWFDIRVH